MVTVERDGNPRRRLGLASPFLGKIADAEHATLEALAAHVAGAVTPSAEPTLLVGLAESSLMLAWSVHRHLPTADLCVSSRQPSGHPRERSFREPHSHAPAHHLVLPEGRYARVVVVEDELTTGRTLANLVDTLEGVAPRYEVVTLADLRSPARRAAMARAFAARGLRVGFADLADATIPARPGAAPPFGSTAATRADLERLLALLEGRRGEARNRTIYAIGECVGLPLGLLHALPRAARLRHVTRSPWRVDAAAIHERVELGCATDGAPYFLYNPTVRADEAPIVIGDEATRPVAAALCRVLRARGARPMTHTVARP